MLLLLLASRLYLLARAMVRFCLVPVFVAVPVAVLVAVLVVVLVVVHQERVRVEVQGQRMSVVGGVL